MIKPKAVIFDLDGTLLDTLQDITDAANTALAEIGLPTHPAQAFRHFIGDGVETLMRRCSGDTLPREGLLKLVERNRLHYTACCTRTTVPYPGIMGMLEALQDRKLPLAVLSNKPDDYSKRMVRHYFPAITFALVLGHGEGRPTKPDPSSALEIAGHLAVKPQDVFFVGDSKTDMLTACAAGMHGLGALWGFRDAEELQSNGAEVLLAKPEDLLKYV